MRVFGKGGQTITGPEAGRSAKVLDALLAGNGLPRAFPRASVRLGALAANRKAQTVTQTAIALDLTQPSDVLGQLATQGTFDRVVSLQKSGDSAEFFVAQIAGRAGGIDAQLFANFTCRIQPQTVKIGQRVLDLFVVRDVNAHQTGHNAAPGKFLIGGRCRCGKSPRRTFSEPIAKNPAL